MVLLASGAVSLGEVSALQHEVLDDAVELAALVALPLRLLRQLLEVFHRLGHCLAKQSNLHSLGGGTTHGDVKPHLELYRQLFTKRGKIFQHNTEPRQKISLT